MPCTFLWPLYTCLWFKLGLQIESTYHQQIRNNYLMGHLSVILHQHNFAENKAAVENLNLMTEVCDDDVGN